jgi:hypothetical protein
VDSNVVVLGFDRDLERTLFGGMVVHEVLDPYLHGPEQHARLVTSDGAADVYSRDLERGFLVSHATGEQVWDLVVEAARVADLAIFPPGRGTCIPDEGLLNQLPAYVPQPVVVVRSGAELLAAMSGEPAPRRADHLVAA